MTEASDATISGHFYEPGALPQQLPHFGIYIGVANAIIQFSAGSVAVETHEQKFDRLKGEWLKAIATTSSLHRIVEHPAYQEIISMGPDVTSLILKDLRISPKPWFYALWKIEGVDPVPASAAGNFRKMTDAWLKWGRKTGHL